MRSAITVLLLTLLVFWTQSNAANRTVTRPQNMDVRACIPHARQVTMSTALAYQTAMGYPNGPTMAGVQPEILKSTRSTTAPRLWLHPVAFNMRLANDVTTNFTLVYTVKDTADPETCTLVSVTIKNLDKEKAH